MKPQANEETIDIAIESFRDGHSQGFRDDNVAVEAPLEIRFGDRNATILMRTPGHDVELVSGFLFVEGFVRSSGEILAIEHPAEQPADFGGQVLHIRLAHNLRKPGFDRNFLSSSSCGACGKSSIDSLTIDAPRIESRISVSSNLLTRLPDILKAAQSTFLRTGGVHASGLFTIEGNLIAIREDVGRHNALDKLIGWALIENRLPLDRSILVLSGRVSYELVQKAIMASIPIIAAVGAPSSMAIELADRYGITLAGFVRHESLNAYTHAWRILETSSQRDLSDRNSRRLE